MCGSSCSFVTAMLMGILGVAACIGAYTQPLYVVSNDLISEFAFEVDLWSGKVTCAKSDNIGTVTTTACDAIAALGLSLTSDLLSECAYIGYFNIIKVGSIAALLLGFVSMVMSAVIGCCRQPQEKPGGVGCCGIFSMGLALAASLATTFYIIKAMEYSCLDVSLNDIPGFTTKSWPLYLFIVAINCYAVGLLCFMCGACQHRSQPEGQMVVLQPGLQTVLLDGNGQPLPAVQGAPGSGVVNQYGQPMVMVQQQPQQVVYTAGPLPPTAAPMQAYAPPQQQYMAPQQQQPRAMPPPNQTVGYAAPQPTTGYEQPQQSPPQGGEASPPQSITSSEQAADCTPGAGGIQEQ